MSRATTTLQTPLASGLRINLIDGVPRLTKEAVAELMGLMDQIPLEDRPAFRNQLLLMVGVSAHPAAVLPEAETESSDDTEQ